MSSLLPPVGYHSRTARVRTTHNSGGLLQAPAFLTSTPVDETAFPLRPLGRPEKRIIQISFRIFTYSYSPRRRFEPTHKEPLPAGEAMRIRGKPTDTHTTPLHARGGRYTRRSGGESAIATAARSLHLSTRGFAARQARQPAPASSSGRGERLVS